MPLNFIPPQAGRRLDNLSPMLGSVVRLTTSTPLPLPSLYARPIRRIISDVSVNLDRALTLVRRCRHGGLVFSITTSADFKKVSSLLEASGGRLKVVGRAGVGIDNADLAAATEHGCLVVNAPTAYTVAAAEHGIGLLTAMSRNVAQADASVKAASIA